MEVYVVRCACGVRTSIVRMYSGLIISENKVHGDGDNSLTFQQNKHADTPSNHSLPSTTLSSHQSAGVPKYETGNVTTSISQRSGNTSSSTFQETVQPIRKVISSGAFVRGFYVFVGLGAIIVMYIVVRTVRLRRKKTAVRKYGVLASREDVELTPLGAEDEDEDMALFDVTAMKSRP